MTFDTAPQRPDDARGSRRFARLDRVGLHRVQGRGYRPCIMRHERIIDLFGGNVALGRLVKRSDSAISRWRANGIPPNFWPMIARLSRKKADREITIEDIAAGAPSPVERSPKARAQQAA